MNNRDTLFLSEWNEFLESQQAVAKNVVNSWKKMNSSQHINDNVVCGLHFGMTLTTQLYGNNWSRILTKKGAMGGS